VPTIEATRGGWMPRDEHPIMSVALYLQKVMIDTTFRIHKVANYHVITKHTQNLRSGHFDLKISMPK
jgi:hypothetical protein